MSIFSGWPLASGLWPLRRSRLRISIHYLGHNSKLIIAPLAEYGIHPYYGVLEAEYRQVVFSADAILSGNPAFQRVCNE
jgi:hypothetical protein